MLSGTHSLKDKFRNSGSFRKHMKLREEENRLSKECTSSPRMSLGLNSNSKEFALQTKKSNKQLGGIAPKLELYSLSKDLHVTILLYLHPSEIIGKASIMSKYWHQLSRDTKIWTLVNKITPLPIKFKYAHEKFIAQRRSKGFIYQARSRLTSQKVSHSLFILLLIDK